MPAASSYRTPPSSPRGEPVCPGAPVRAPAGVLHAHVPLGHGNNDENDENDENNEAPPPPVLRLPFLL